MQDPLEMYLARGSSHGHRTHAWAAPTHAWANECDPPETWDANRKAVIESADNLMEDDEYVQSYLEDKERHIRVRAKRLWWASIIVCSCVLVLVLVGIHVLLPWPCRVWRAGDCVLAVVSPTTTSRSSGVAHSTFPKDV